MNKFIKNIFFFLFPLIVILMFFYLLFNLDRSYIDDSFKLDKKINTIILGDSHSTLCIDDQYISNSKNFSNYSESYIFNYYKLKYIYKLNPQINHVMLSCSYHNFAKYYDESTFNSEFVGKYFFFLPFSEQKNFLKQSENRISLLKYSIINSFNNYFINDSTSFMGSYHNIKVDKSVSKEYISKRIEKQYSNLDSNDFESEINKIYFKKIVDFCSKNNLKLTLFRTPLYSEYMKEIPYIIIENYKKTTNKYKVIEFDSLFKDKEYFMPDGDHLKIKGAKKFSKLIDSIIID